MILELLDRLRELRERVVYEKERVRKVVPVLIRFGISELEDLYERFQHWRGACDHTSPRPQKTSVRRVRRKPK